MGSQPLGLRSLILRETRYSLEMDSRFECSATRFNQAIPIMLRGLQMCAHETYMDCPYYEQLMYAGDTRLQVLVTLALTRDDRLPRKALALLGESLDAEGFTLSRYPAHSAQLIAPFSLYWCGMVHDHALWRGHPEFIRERMPGVRAVLDAFARYRNDEGLLAAVKGWNFVDWVPGWERGTPPAAAHGSANPRWRRAGSASPETWRPQPRAGSGTSSAGLWPTIRNTAASPSTPSAWPC